MSVSIEYFLVCLEKRSNTSTFVGFFYEASNLCIVIFLEKKDNNKY